MTIVSAIRPYLPDYSSRLSSLQKLPALANTGETSSRSPPQDALTGGSALSRFASALFTGALARPYDQIPIVSVPPEDGLADDGGTAVGADGEPIAKSDGTGISPDGIPVDSPVIEDTVIEDIEISWVPEPGSDGSNTGIVVADGTSPQVDVAGGEIASSLTA